MICPQPPNWSDQVGRIQPEAKRTFYVEAAEVFAACRDRGVKPSGLRAYVNTTTMGDRLGNPIPWKSDQRQAA
jgi:hypothetical protein